MFALSGAYWIWRNTQSFSVAYESLIIVQLLFQNTCVENQGSVVKQTSNYEFLNELCYYFPIMNITSEPKTFFLIFNSF